MRKSVAYWLALGVTGIVLYLPQSARATLTIKVDSLTTPSPTSVTNGVLNIAFNVTQPDSSRPMSGYQIQLLLVPVGTAQGMSFVSPFVQNNPNNPVFPSSPPTDLGSNATTIQATASLPAGSTSIADGMGLIQVDYQLAAGAAGIYNVDINPAITLLTDDSPTPGLIAYTPSNGVVTLTPEPSSACLLLLAGVWPLMRRRR
ncbi:MAG TPA: hypothetical protein VFE47_22780 [Tepidisphaeraceae bacterium]|jgi:hypothetical protein|nr:hypothetical protein [Tepidisphaeraceae bacterium]